MQLIMRTRFVLRTLWPSAVQARPALSHVAWCTGLHTSTRTFLSAKSSEGGVQVDWGNGVKTRFDAQHLLDHCRCPKCFHPVTKQRLKQLSDFPENAGFEAVSVVENKLHVDWKGGHSSVYPESFLARVAYDPPVQPQRTDEYAALDQQHGTAPDSRRILWNSQLSKSLPNVTFESYGTDDGLKRVLDLTHTYGFCLVSGMPATGEATEAAIKRIGRIRETHYGGFWDFTSDMSHGDLAYSSVALPAHTDTTYFTDPAGLQIFHLLSHQGEGGATLLVDGFYAAAKLKELHPESYAILARTPVPCHASGTPGTMLRPFLSSPVLTLQDGSLKQVRWNNEDRGILTGMSAGHIRDWYKAARRYEKLLKEDAELWLQLEPGTMLIIDNWRVMHGRSAFTGARRMCGAYIGADEWRSKRALLQQMEGLWDIGW